MNNISKIYTIKFSKRGINQYVNFTEDNGIIINPKLYVNWVTQDEIPDVSKCKTIDEILEIIKEFSYNNQAEIYLINYQPISYFHNIKAKELVKNIQKEHGDFILQKLNLFFQEILVPILIKNKWFIGNSEMGRYVLIKKDENEEWDNISKIEEFDKKEFEFEYLCARVLKDLDIIDEIKIQNESYNNLFVSHLLFNRIDEFPEYFIKL